MRNKTARTKAVWRPYEQVLNTDPCYVFLCDANTKLENSVAIAHAVAHSDFFHNNRHCVSQPVSILPFVRTAAQKINGYEQTYGQGAVESVLDAAIALRPHVKFLDNTTEPANGCCDLLYYIITHARHLQPWERDILCIVRDQALCLQPQQQTQVINEGWACFWHTELIRQLPLSPLEVIQFAAMQAALFERTQNANPYLLGHTVFQHIAANGQTHSRKYDADMLFSVRAMENDSTFLAKYAPVTMRNAVLVNPVPVIQAQGTETLYLNHIHNGLDLDMRLANGTLQLLAGLWRAKIILQTSVQGRPVTLTVE
jgi:stage V sporulation protein R